MKRVSILLSFIMIVSLLVGIIASCSTETAKNPSVTTTAPETAAVAANTAPNQPEITTAAQASTAPKTVLRIACPWPFPGDDQGENVALIMDKFNAKMTQLGANYVMEIHPAESLVKMMENMDAVRTGAVELAGFPIGPFSGLDPVFNAAEMPFMYNTVNADAAAQAKLLPYYSAITESKFNQKALGAWTVLGLEMCSTVPVKTLADWNGLLVQSISPLNASFVKAMGGAPVAMSFTEAYQAIQKKIVTATMQAPSMVLSYKLYEIAKNETLGYLQPASAMATVNLDVYNKMPQNVKDALVQAGQEAMQEANDKMIKRAATNIPALIQNGMDIYYLPKAERDTWKAKVQPLVDDLISKMGDFGTSFKQVADEVNTNYPYPTTTPTPTTTQQP